MLNWDRINNDSNLFGERNDCSVRAIAAATDTPYETVHALFKQTGRRKGSGTRRHQQMDVIRKLGYDYKDVSSSYVAKTLRTLQNEVMSNSGNLIVYVRSHMLAIVDGKLLDGYRTKNSKRRVIDIFEVVKVKDVDVSNLPKTAKTSAPKAPRPTRRRRTKRTFTHPSTLRVGLNKREMATALYKLHNSYSSPKELQEMFIRDLDMTKASASTYYYDIKSQSRYW